MPGTLYLVSTPIGNLGDLSHRAAETMRNADFIAAEDTRVTIKLLNYLDIKKPLVSYYEHNRQRSGERIIERLLSGESCALVSDAGTPAISDPGEDLVKRCVELGIGVCAIPGPCALISALTVSGFPTGRFCFEGFLSTANKKRRDHLAALAGETRTMVFYEAPHKLTRTLSDLLGAFGDRELAIAREITKLHEEILRTTLSAALARFTETPPRGEMVLVIRGAKEAGRDSGYSEDDALELVSRFRQEGHTLSEAAKLAAKQCGMPRSELYSLALNRVRDLEGGDDER